MISVINLCLGNGKILMLLKMLYKYMSKARENGILGTIVRMKGNFQQYCMLLFAFLLKNVIFFK